MRLVAVLAVLVLGSVGAGDADARPGSRTDARRERVAQAPDPIAQAQATVQKAEGTRYLIATERAPLTRRYEGQLKEVEKLKRQKASWRRDRALRAQLAASLETARALSALAERIKKADAEIARARAAGVVAIDRAMPRMSPGPRRSEVIRLRMQWAPPPPPPRKILIPNEMLDPLADPEELDLQADSLRDSEAELMREVNRLEQQATRFDHMAKLRKQHERADELARRDEADPRRIGTTARSTAADGAAEPNGIEEGLGPAPPEGDIADTRGDDGRDFATALSEVVDPSTVDALRRAEQSTDPGARAAVARRARDAVNQRLVELRKRRTAIENRARELRAP